MTQLFNKKLYTTRRKELRNNATNPENVLWYYLKSRGFHGYKFRRQFGIGVYIVDFYCPKLKLAIEIDGDSHFNDISRNHDTIRDAFLKQLGITTIRFTNLDITANLNGVWLTLENFIFGTSPSPSFVRRGRR